MYKNSSFPISKRKINYILFTQFFLFRFLNINYTIILSYFIQYTVIMYWFQNWEQEKLWKHIAYAYV